MWSPFGKFTWVSRWTVTHILYVDTNQWMNMELKIIFWNNLEHSLTTTKKMIKITLTIPVPPFKSNYMFFWVMVRWLLSVLSNYILISRHPCLSWWFRTCHFDGWSSTGWHFYPFRDERWLKSKSCCPRLIGCLVYWTFRDLRWTKRLQALNYSHHSRFEGPLLFICLLPPTWYQIRYKIRGRRVPVR